MRIREDFSGRDVEGGESRTSPERRVGKTKASRGEPRVLLGPVEEEEEAETGTWRRVRATTGSGREARGQVPAGEAKAESTGPRQLLRRHRHQPLRGRGRTRSEGRHTCFHSVRSQVQGGLFPATKLSRVEANDPKSTNTYLVLHCP